MIMIRRELGKDAVAREALLDIGYGCARFGKVSQRLREGRQPSAGLAFVASDRGHIVGTVRLWDVAAGDRRPALLLGPLTVHPEHRCRGVGHERCVAIARICARSSTPLAPHPRVPRGIAGQNAS